MSISDVQMSNANSHPLSHCYCKVITVQEGNQQNTLVQLMITRLASKIMVSRNSDKSNSLNNDNPKVVLSL